LILFDKGGIILAMVERPQHAGSLERPSSNIQEIIRSSSDVDRIAADTVLNLVANKPHAILLLPTGNTPRGMYSIIAQESNHGRNVDFSNVKVMNLDEYWPMPKNHFASFRSYMKRHFYDHVNIPREQRYIADSSYPEAASELYMMQKRLEVFKKHGIDLAVVGIGRNGHLGFNEPGTPHDSETSIVRLTEETRMANAPDFAVPDERMGLALALDVPKFAITLGLGESGIRAAGHIMMVAKGNEKSDALYRAFRQPPSEEVPASVLQYHPHVTLVADYAAAGMLR
jgi:glucosamine-6-phosphate deaminase